MLGDTKCHHNYFLREPQAEDQIFHTRDRPFRGQLSKTKHLRYKALESEGTHLKNLALGKEKHNIEVLQKTRTDVHTHASVYAHTERHECTSHTT